MTRQLRDLEIGESLVILPDGEESTEKLFARINRQVSRLSILGMHFHRTKQYRAVKVTRCEKYQDRKLAPIINLELGERILYAESFDSTEYPRLLSKLTYYFDRHRRQLFAEQDPDGKVYLRCHSRGDDKTWGAELREQGEKMPRLKIICPKRLPQGWQ